ncbi:hypothetical protein AV530_015425 [Patagioenas fasciata monilis]|uniref:Uncharacterized protein n=1 Tax=Patagioenas fasciata monilis TaxID=372326 RepID=A0A1V4JWU4_PATFA|nr:hypothetical protein AV530_015425 [Patagioenas fasciata monilis]
MAQSIAFVVSQATEVFSLFFRFCGGCWFSVSTLQPRGNDLKLKFPVSLNFTPLKSVMVLETGLLLSK